MQPKPHWCCFPADRIPPPALPGRCTALRASKCSASPTASATRSNWNAGTACWRASDRCAPDWAAKLGESHTLEIPTLAEISDTALTRDVAIAMGEDGLPNTFVPGRNLVFLTFAAALAYRRGIRHIIGGMCETDYSGYPDCRDETIKALQTALNLGMAKNFELHTPLMWLDKASTWKLAHDLGGAGLVDLIREHSHTCYLGERGAQHDWGYGCGECPACACARRVGGNMRARHCEEPTGPAYGRPDDKLRDEAIHASPVELWIASWSLLSGGASRRPVGSR